MKKRKYSEGKKAGYKLCLIDGVTKFLGYNDHIWSIYRGQYDGVFVWSVYVSNYYVLETKSFSDIEKLQDVFFKESYLDDACAYWKLAE